MGRIVRITARLALSLILVVGTLATFSVVDSSAVGESTGRACEGLEELGVNCDETRSAEEVATGPIRSLINILLIVVGAASVFMIILGGFKFVSSGGDTEKTKSARNTIIYAAVGLALVLLSSFIVSFVFSASDRIENGPAPGESGSGSSRPAGGSEPGIGTASGGGNSQDGPGN